MPTSEERREVAESLRARSIGLAFSYPDVRDSLNGMWIQRTLREVREAIWCEGNPHPARWLLRLADLVDPTCEVESMELRDESDEATPYTLTLSCGHRMGAESYGDIPRYCPVCGARVVD